MEDKHKGLYEEGMNGWCPGDRHHIERMASMSMTANGGSSVYAKASTSGLDASPSTGAGSDAASAGVYHGSGFGLKQPVPAGSAAVANVSVDRPASPPSTMAMQVQVPGVTSPAAPAPAASLGAKDW